ncbi:archaea-specific SMC-related protein [Haloarcula nitratireducens]|uniref:Chromosome segregation protein SMC n=1 Tax=Haloarcula nitratireducens TaxID=2487749 RepID=A0AAW4PGY8_9EURY|nr:archaea-specific SMC-related protein [Halomicroarcula nitratireducens]MBX0297007.1 chromosome segregation protein SMC [Halomicroarcula nitratireducens]
MTKSSELGQRSRFEVENIGGIDDTAVEIPPGVTVLTGKNATNRTSFLQAIIAGMGSDRATVKGDADEAQVILIHDGETYDRTLSRDEEGNVISTGEGLLSDPAVAELFAFLLETNEARRAVALDEDLRRLIMRPVDIDELRTEIRQTNEEKQAINDELATIESVKRELPELEQQRTELRERIETKRAELTDLETEIDRSSGEIEETRKEQERLEDKLEALRDRRSELATVRDEIDKQEESLAALKQDRTELQRDQDELDESSDDTERDIDARLSQLREEKRARNAEINDLQSVITFNEEMLEDADSAVLNAVEKQPETMGDITNQLLERQQDVTCWTCGSSVEKEDIERTLDQLQTYRQEQLDEIRSIESELEQLKEQQREQEQMRKRRADIERQLAEIDDEVAERTDRLEQLRTRRSELTTEIETLESEVESLRVEDFDEVLELHKEANQLEFDIEQLESELESVAEEIAEKEATIAEADDLRERREELMDELEDLRTRIDQLERAAVEQFNTHMEQVLDILGYDNLDRIWIERRTQADSGGLPTAEESTTFELHVVRTTETGAAYEDTIAHLSESEREVTGLIFALAGYLVHDLHETVPFMLMDSLEAIDSARIADLVDYFAEFAEYLIVALLPEDAQALPESYNRVTDI